MKLGRGNFLTAVEYEGYLEAGKAFGNPNYWRAGTTHDAEFKFGWNVRKAEIDGHDPIEAMRQLAVAAASNQSQGA